MSKTKTKTATTTEPKPKTNKQKENKTMPPTMEYDLGEAEDFKLPSTGVHEGNLAGAENDISKKSGKDMTVVTVTLSSGDPDAPNLPLRKYLTWPVESDRDKMYGTRKAFGAQLPIKDCMTAFGGQESGKITKETVLTFLTSKVGMAVKVKVKLEAKKDQVTGEVLVPIEYQANVDKLLPA